MKDMIKEYKKLKNSGCNEMEVSYVDYINKYDDCDKKPNSYNSEKKTIVIYMPCNYRIPEENDRIDDDRWKITDMIQAEKNCSLREVSNLLKTSQIYKDWEIMKYIKIIDDDNEKEKMYEMIKTQQPMENWSIIAERNTSYYVGYDALLKVDSYYEREHKKHIREMRKGRNMENRKICRMIEILEERSDKYKNDIMKTLKTEEDFNLAVKIFEVSDRRMFRKSCEMYDYAMEQARYTIKECLNELFEDQKIDFRSGDISLYEKIEWYVVNKIHIRVLTGHKTDDSAILFREDADFAPDVSGELTWMATIFMNKIRYTLFEDSYDGFCIDTHSLPDEETMEKVEKWYYDNGFEFEKRQKEVELND